ncbi:HAD-IB family hydrolase [Streptomyces sp. B-S-A8]|uniref:HAD-IB family hydrolase n=1 Tax=Streptomyces solicavernae TaxID=3043614 RepID=A0ABT6S1Y9_9ACTN|nr:HAD-IB family hydrolase [Streptomyces sp. B-S-A8]MDI3390702.1 HAD-IB family hydrolase [Streptomyces sp. B-S-A8]
MNRRIAFFDVDETLLAGKSMLSFWHFWAARAARRGRALPTPRSTGADRETLNRAYFRAFAGVPLVQLESAARSWYEEFRRGPRVCLTESVEALLRHRSSGHEVALVTGAGEMLVRPLAEELGVRHVLATEVVTDAAGVLTGEVRRPRLGDAKRTAATALAVRLGARPRDCFAYADHSTDLPLLTAVGHPVVVGDDPVLAARAAAEGWPRAGTETGPLPRGAVPAQVG